MEVWIKGLLSTGKLNQNWASYVILQFCVGGPSEEGIEVKSFGINIHLIRGLGPVD